MHGLSLNQTTVLDGLLWGFDNGAFEGWEGSNGKPLSKSDIRRLLNQGAIRINGVKVNATDPWPEPLKD